MNFYKVVWNPNAKTGVKETMVIEAEEMHTDYSSVNFKIAVAGMLQDIVVIPLRNIESVFHCTEDGKPLHLVTRG